MSEKAREALKNIVRAAERTEDGYVMQVEIPARDSDERRRICTELTARGCISSVEPYGRNYIRCQVERIAYSYLED